MRNQWQKARAGANKVFESCNKKMSDGIVAFNEGCKHVWENKYEIALSVAKNIYKNKYEIGADMVGRRRFCRNGRHRAGTAALVGGAAYAAYTVGRRVIYEAYKQKKEHPDKSYKEIYTNGKFLTKAVFSVGAAAVSWGIAGTAASVGADVATQTAAGSCQTTGRTENGQTRGNDCRVSNQQYRRRGNGQRRRRTQKRMEESGNVCSRRRGNHVCGRGLQ